MNKTNLLDQLQMNRIYVGNLSEKIQPSSLYSHFIECGKILTIQKRYSKYAFVEFELIESAEYAIEKFHNSFLKGHKIIVNKILNEEEKKYYISKHSNTIASYGEILKGDTMESYIGKNSIYNEDNQIKCQIIVENIYLRNYAEDIKNLISDLGLKSNIFISSPSFELNKLLKKFKDEFIEVVVYINKKNQQMKSLCVIFLQREAVRHDNIPSNDAIKLIYKHIKIESQNPLYFKHPTFINKFLEDLIHNQSLTVLQYDSLIEYLNELKEEQKKFEIGDGATFERRKLFMNSDQNTREIMQNQILKILSEKSEMKLKKTKKLSEIEKKNLLQKLKNDQNVQAAINELKKSRQMKEITAGPSGIA
ncbi:hypothetical protein PVAND_014788 [Polypedilum vanderplanki]|uniref:RRM domain-containing protein n=1 Tax=Polypedilum vanderplanki TaxID=319348 RepID=A0A9J6BAR0_POLVA|nr:hypothetical protein PVAND_014788 [Polypedilum vanderplanki]